MLSNSPQESASSSNSQDPLPSSSLIEEHPSNLRSVKSPKTLGQRLKSVGTGLGSLWKKTTSPALFLSPHQVADKIRRLCHHDKTTISQRHLDVTSKSSDKMSESDVIITLCKRLVRFASSQYSVSTQIAAKTEIFALAINDPGIRGILQRIVTQDQLIGLLQAVVDFFPEPNMAAVDFHDMWSIVLGHRLFEGNGETFVESCSNHLKEVLTGPHARSFLLSLEYLGYALALDTDGRELWFLLRIWEHFLQNLPNHADSFNWYKMDTFIYNILSSGKSLSDFVSPTRLSSLAPHLMR
ncbi:hypothetical protein SCHPADRAFT_578135 [Schizopora paradoxa]|uniref:Uncharacterized protein n=1 Tax=Schizopora paradoxa TaxID=27342 RepID=A0A0H2RB99_9AGAM|nr:hypothetical protein SCHPADRAFT_578135 [Schizopora paradoxa]